MDNVHPVQTTKNVSAFAFFSDYRQCQGICISDLLVDSWIYLIVPIRKPAYSNILRILPLKIENFQIKGSGSFHISAQNIDCGYL